MTLRHLLDGKAALITGGARGIGSACVERLSDAGAAVVIADRLGDEANAVAERIRESGGRAAALMIDLTQTDRIPAMVEDAEAAFGRLDILVNNAGISLDTTTEAITEAEWDLVMNANLKAVFFVTQAALPALLRQGKGAIVNISSIVARSGGVNSTADYTASKGGVLALTRVLAREYGPRSIRVNAVTPGPIMTEMIAEWPKERLNDLVERIPLRRLGTAADVADCVVFLASPLADYLTGVGLDVAGGIYMS
jgi:NAD(P)-dependent dehydrogenase (short-subunit alcohol dehydrogenase family)